jgi:exportin-1
VQVYSETISAQVASGGVHVSQTPQFRAMRSVKKEVSRLLQCYVEKCEDTAMLYANFIPPMLQAILGDYKSIVPEARDAEVLSLLTSIINKMKVHTHTHTHTHTHSSLSLSLSLLM